MIYVFLGGGRVKEKEQRPGFAVACPFGTRISESLQPPRLPPSSREDTGRKRERRSFSPSPDPLPNLGRGNAIDLNRPRLSESILPESGRKKSIDRTDSFTVCVPYPAEGTLSPLNRSLSLYVSRPESVRGKGLGSRRWLVHLGRHDSQPSSIFTVAIASVLSLLPAWRQLAAPSIHQTHPLVATTSRSLPRHHLRLWDRSHLSMVPGRWWWSRCPARAG